LVSRSPDKFTIILYNYVDPERVMNYFSREVATLKKGDRKDLLGVIKSDKLERILQGKLGIDSLRISVVLKKFLKGAVEFNNYAYTKSTTPRTLTLGVKNRKGMYLCQVYRVDSSCNSDCAFGPTEEKVVELNDSYRETIVLKPYSVQMWVFKKQPLQAAAAPVAPRSTEGNGNAKAQN